MKIAIFLPNLCGGGAEHALINLASAIAALNVDVDLIVGVAKGEHLESTQNLSLVNLHSSSMLRSIWPLMRYLKSNGSVHLISAMPHANIAAIIAAKLAGGSINIVITEHAVVEEQIKAGTLKDKLVLMATKFFYRFADGMVAVSNGVLNSQKRFLGRAIPINYQVIFNPIVSHAHLKPSIEYVRGESDNSKKKIIISAGRLSHEKNFLLLLNAFSRLKNNSNLVLYVYGEGPLRRDLESLSRDLLIADKVFFPGFTHQLAEKLQGADLFVLPSRREGFGNVLVEALASGCAIISTNCPVGPIEILENGRFGILVPSEDENSLVRAMDLVLNEGGAIQYNADEAVKRFLPERIARQYIEFLNRCSQVNG